MNLSPFAIWQFQRTEAVRIAVDSLPLYKCIEALISYSPSYKGAAAVFTQDEDKIRQDLCMWLSSRFSGMDLYSRVPDGEKLLELMLLDLGVEPEMINE